MTTTKENDEPSYPISIRAAAKRLGVSRGVAAALIVTGRIPTYRDSLIPNGKCMGRPAYLRLGRAVARYRAELDRLELASA
jgi:hypothetical protein